MWLAEKNVAQRFDEPSSPFSGRKKVTEQKNQAVATNERYIEERREENDQEVERRRGRTERQKSKRVARGGGQCLDEGDTANADESREVAPNHAQLSYHLYSEAPFAMMSGSQCTCAHSRARDTERERGRGKLRSPRKRRELQGLACSGGRRGSHVDMISAAVREVDTAERTRGKAQKNAESERRAIAKW